MPKILLLYSMINHSIPFMRYYLKLILCFALVPLSAFSKTNAKLKPGNWHGTLQLNDTVELPIIFKIDGVKIIFINGEEKIIVDEITFEKPYNFNVLNYKWMMFKTGASWRNLIRGKLSI